MLRRTPLAFIHHHSLPFGPSTRELGRPTLKTASLASMTMAFLPLAHVFRTRSSCARQFPSPPGSPRYVNSQSTRALLSDVIDWHMLQYMSPKSTLRVSEGSYSATVISSEDQSHFDLADGDNTRSWYQEYMPINTPLDHNHRYKHAHTTSDSSVSSTLSAGVYTTSTVAQYRDQRASREMPQGSKRSEEGPAAESPRSPLRSNWKRGAPPGRYRCTCGRDYAQPQGLTRHRRETHEAYMCMYCGAFAWARPYRFREHVKRKHPGVDPDVALEKATYLNTRRSVTNKTKDLPQLECASPSAETRLYPSSLPPALPVSLPAVSPVDHELQPGSAEFAESTMEMHKYEDARDLSKSLGANYAHIKLPPSKQRAQVEKTDPDMSAVRVGITARE
jgi:hypothetical protein